MSIVLCVIAILLILEISWSKDPYKVETNAATSSPGGYAGSTPTPLDIQPISTALDEKNGFKDFKFGMSCAQAYQIMPPTLTNQHPGAVLTDYIYRTTPVNRIGDFSIDALTLSFFDDRLYRIDIHFSSFQKEIFDAFRLNFGDSFDSDNWKRGDQPLQAKAWHGQKVTAAILSLPGQLWDSAVLYEIATYQKEAEYIAREPERAAKDFGTNGFKTLLMGTRIREISFSFNIVDDDQTTGVKKIVFAQDQNTANLWMVGFYPVTSVAAEFFHDKLYRIDLAFEANRKEIYATLQHRFGQLQDNDSWTRGAEKLKAQSGGDGNLFAAILAPQPFAGGATNWDSIVLIDRGLWKEVEKFKADAPNRAAKDF